MLARNKWNVTVLTDGHDLPVAEEWFEAAHVSIQHVDHLVCESERAQIAIDSMSSFQSRSRGFNTAIQTMMERDKCDYDLIEFSAEAASFIPIQMKKSSRSYEGSKIILKVQYPPAGADPRKRGQQVTWDGLINDYIDRYSFENADSQVFTSRTLLNQYHRQGWKVKSNATVCPVAYRVGTELRICNDLLKRQEITYVGQFTEWDIQRFVDTLRQIDKDDPSFPQTYRVAFVRYDNAGGSILPGTLRRMLAPYSTEFHNFHNVEEALEHLKSRTRLAIVGADNDGSPYPIVACMALGVPFVAMNRDDAVEGLGLESELRRAVTSSVSSMDHLIRTHLSYDAVGLEALLNKAFRRAREICDPNRVVKWYEQMLLPRRGRGAKLAEHRVTVIIPTRNVSRSLEVCLESIEAQTYNNYEIIIRDSSTNHDEFQQTKQLAKRYRALFLHRGDTGICNAMNHGLKHVDTEYVMEFDADNIAAPHMIETFVQGMEYRHDVVALSSYNGWFRDEEENNLRQNLHQGTLFTPRSCYTPVGLCLPNLFLYNVAGDASSIYLTRALREIGGWPRDDRVPQDWLLWLKFVETGRRMDVIPDVLYYYRLRENSASKQRDLIQVNLGLISAIQRIIREQPERFCGSYSNIHRLLRGMDSMALENQELMRDSQELHQVKQSVGYRFMRFYGAWIDRLLLRDRHAEG